MHTNFLKEQQFYKRWNKEQLPSGRSDRRKENGFVRK